MGKKIVIYYSLEGNTRLIATNIAEAIEAELLEIEPVKDISPTGFSRYLWGGKQVVMKEKPKLKEYDLDLANYDTIFLGTPVWAGSYTPAINTFLVENNLREKKVALFCCHAGGKGRVFLNFKKALPNNIVLGEQDFIEPLKKNKEMQIAQAKKWAEEILV